GRHGGVANAFTTADATTYFETLPANGLKTALTIEADRMRSSVFEPEDINAERAVILSERDVAEDQNEVVLEEELWASAFHVHPYRLPILGYEGDLAMTARETLYDRYRTYYTPNNAFLVLVGGFEPAEALRWVRKAFGGIEREPLPTAAGAAEPEQMWERRSEATRPGGVDLLAVGWHVPAFNHKDTPALIVL